MSDEIVEEPNIIVEEVFVRISEVKKEQSPATMNSPGRGGIPPSIPLIPPIDPLVWPRGLPIVVLQGLVAVDMPSHLPKFYGTKDEDPSRHMERFIERVASSFITTTDISWFGFLIS